MGLSPSHSLLGLLCLLLRISEYSELAGVKTIFMITSKETTANGVARVALQKVARWCLSYQVKQKTNRIICCQEIAPSRRVLRWAIINRNCPPQISGFSFFTSFLHHREGTFECVCNTGCSSTVSHLPFSSKDQCEAHLTGIIVFFFFFFLQR